MKRDTKRCMQRDIARSKGYVSERAIYPRTKTSRATLPRGFLLYDPSYPNGRINANASKLGTRTPARFHFPFPPPFPFSLLSGCRLAGSNKYAD